MLFPLCYVALYAYVNYDHLRAVPATAVVRSAGGLPQKVRGLHIYIYIYIYISLGHVLRYITLIYIYICLCVCLCMYIYNIYIYIERERERERESIKCEAFRKKCEGFKAPSFETEELEEEARLMISTSNDSIHNHNTANNNDKHNPTNNHDDNI